MSLVHSVRFFLHHVDNDEMDDWTDGLALLRLVVGNHLCMYEKRVFMEMEALVYYNQKNLLLP